MDFSPSPLDEALHLDGFLFSSPFGARSFFSIRVTLQNTASLPYTHNVGERERRGIELNTWLKLATGWDAARRITLSLFD